MNSKWKEFISKFEVAEATAPTAALSDLLAAPEDLGLVEISGEDAGTFLQAHFTNDVMAIGQGQLQLSGYCSPKGRLLALFYIFRKADSYFLLTKAEIIESLVKRLGMFAQMPKPAGKDTLGKVTRTNVELSDVSADYALLGVSGTQSTQQLSKFLSTEIAVPADSEGLSGSVVLGNGVIAVSVRSSSNAIPRWLCLGSFESLSLLWTQLAQTATPVSAERWQLEDIRAGIPSIVLATQDKVVPQMANMQVLQGISFTKGCYPGQEIVARMQYLGTLKRHTARYRYAGAPVAPGTEIVASDDAGAGLVLSSAVADDGHSELLAVVKISKQDTELMLGEGSTPLVHVDLPYTMTEG